MSLAAIDLRAALGFSLRDKDYSAEMEGEPEPRLGPEAIGELSPQDARLWALARRIFEPERMYSSEEVLAKIQEATGVDLERALRGFAKMGRAGALIPTYGDRYFRGDSSPF